MLAIKTQISIAKKIVKPSIQEEEGVVAVATEIMIDKNIAIRKIFIENRIKLLRKALEKSNRNI